MSPYVDGELSAAERRAVAAHIEQCRACAALVADFQRIGRTIAEAGAEPAPSSLALRVRASLAREAEAQESEALPSVGVLVGRIKALKEANTIESVLSQILLRRP